MTWLAAALKPIGLLILFGAALAISFLLRPLIPDGRIKDLLYDRTYRDRHPERFNGLAIGLIVVLVFFMLYVYHR